MKSSDAKTAKESKRLKAALRDYQKILKEIEPFIKKKERREVEMAAEWRISCSDE